MKYLPNEAVGELASPLSGSADLLVIGKVVEA